VIPGNLDHGGSDRSAGPGNQGDENESAGVGTLSVSREPGSSAHAVPNAR
jgi:hypothetical protein